MSNLVVPSPGGDDSQNAGGEKHQHNKQGPNRAGQRERRQPKKPFIPGPDDCLQAFAQVAGLVAMGILKPAQANTILAAYRGIYQHHMVQAKQAEKGLGNADVLELARKDPKLAELLSPLLTPEQLEMLVRDAEDDADGQA